jgi:hypothetical protein
MAHDGNCTRSVYPVERLRADHFLRGHMRNLERLVGRLDTPVTTIVPMRSLDLTVSSIYDRASSQICDRIEGLVNMAGILFPGRLG